MRYTRFPGYIQIATQNLLKIANEMLERPVISSPAESSMANRITAISIGMPVYNGAKYIGQALDSLLAQTFLDFELIISDNASTDDTETICQSYERLDSRIRYVRQAGNLGALANFQFVLDQAKGPFFMWAAADDLWDNQWVETLYLQIRDDKTVAAFGELVHIDANASPLTHPANGAKLHFEGARLRRKLAFYLAYEGMGKANLFYALYPRDLLKCIELRPGLLDYQILFALLDHIAYVPVKGPKFHKRIHGDSEGVSADNLWRSPIVLAPARLLRRDFQITTHYLQNASPGLQLILLLLAPFKLLETLMFRVTQCASMLPNWLQLR